MLIKQRHQLAKLGLVQRHGVLAELHLELLAGGFWLVDLLLFLDMLAKRIEKRLVETKLGQVQLAGCEG